MQIVESQQRDHFQGNNNYNEVDICNPPTHVQRELDTILDLIATTHPEHITDFGAGTGRLTIPLLQAGYYVTAVDISSDALSRLKSLAGNLNLDRRLTISTTLPKQNKFIVGSDVLHHIDLTAFIPMFYKSLRANGKVMFSEPNGLNPAWYLFFLARTLRERQNIFSIERGITQVTNRNLNRVLSSNGFSEIAITNLGLLPTRLMAPFTRLKSMNYRLGAWPLLHHFSWRKIVSAIKVD